MLPRSAAFLYLNKEWVHKVKPVVTGNFMGEGPAREFFWTGTRDQTAATCVGKAFEYIDSIGQDKILEHGHTLAVHAGKAVA